ncbi:MAG: competence protein ComJ [Acidobacteriota bacterium]
MEKRVDVSYTQLCVFRADLDEPFNDWEPTHVAQGFAWREGSVSFRTFENGGHRVVVREQDDPPSLASETVRAIVVPFDVPEEGRVEVASIADGFELVLPAGPHALTCEIGERKGASWCRLTFVRTEHVEPAVLRCDDLLAPPEELLMRATSA